MTLSEWAGGSENNRARVILAYVMTDVVGSTQIAIELGDIMWSEEVQKHFERARLLINEFDGYIIKFIGDAVFAVFQNASDALAFAMGFTENTGNDRFQIRSSVHVGSAIIQDADMSGKAISFTDRMLEYAGPDEIKVSEIARWFIESDRNPRDEAVAIEPAGTCNLKNFGDMELYSVVIERQSASSLP